MTDPNPPTERELRYQRRQAFAPPPPPPSTHHTSAASHRSTPRYSQGSAVPSFVRAAFDTALQDISQFRSSPSQLHHTAPPSPSHSFSSFNLTLDPTATPHIPTYTAPPVAYLPAPLPAPVPLTSPDSSMDFDPPYSMPAVHISSGPASAALSTFVSAPAYAGKDPVKFSAWSKAVKRATLHAYRVGTSTRPPMTEPVLAAIGDQLSGELKQWHARSWRMVVALHHGVVLDWISHGSTMDGCATRARTALEAMAREDLASSPIVQQLRDCRHAYYCLHPDQVPLTLTTMTVMRPDGTTYLEKAEMQRPAAQQAHIDTLFNETLPYLRKAFLIPPGDSTPALYRDPAYSEPRVRYLKETSEPAHAPPRVAIPATPTSHPAVPPSAAAINPPAAPAAAHAEIEPAAPDPAAAPEGPPPGSPLLNCHKAVTFPVQVPEYLAYDSTGVYKFWGNFLNWGLAINLGPAMLRWSR